MNVQVRLHRTRTGVRQDRRAALERRQVSRPDTEAQLRRAREAGQSQDEALYRCRCGFVFRAQVSTSVHCPHCDSTQAW
jgi:predicted Zn-ribbon and HTH transcriptional regulator